jgi:hypothetical protein
MVKKEYTLLNPDDLAMKDTRPKLLSIELSTQEANKILVYTTADSKILSHFISKAFHNLCDYTKLSLLLKSRARSISISIIIPVKL